MQYRVECSSYVPRHISHEEDFNTHVLNESGQNEERTCDESHHIIRCRQLGEAKACCGPQCIRDGNNVLAGSSVSNFTDKRKQTECEDH